MENLQNLLLSGVTELAPRPEGLGSGAMPRRADTFEGYDSSPTILNKSKSPPPACPGLHVLYHHCIPIRADAIPENIVCYSLNVTWDVIIRMFVSNIRAVFLKKLSPLCVSFPIHDTNEYCNTGIVTALIPILCLCVCMC